nr:MAG TPA: hypothetical protein [Caudoviricetes sp.]
MPATLILRINILRRASPLYGCPPLRVGGIKHPPHTGGDARPVQPRENKKIGL